jgi:hypothetical protein
MSTRRISMQPAGQKMEGGWQPEPGVGLAEMVCLFPDELALHPTLSEETRGRRLQHYQVAESVLTAAFLELTARGVALMVQEHSNPLYRVWMHRLARDEREDMSLACLLSTRITKRRLLSGLAIETLLHYGHDPWDHFLKHLVQAQLADAGYYEPTRPIDSPTEALHIRWLPVEARIGALRPHLARAHEELERLRVHLDGTAAPGRGISAEVRRTISASFAEVQRTPE